MDTALYSMTMHYADGTDTLWYGTAVSINVIEQYGPAHAESLAMGESITIKRVR